MHVFPYIRMGKQENEQCERAHSQRALDISRPVPLEVVRYSPRTCVVFSAPQLTADLRVLLTIVHVGFVAKLLLGRSSC